MARSSNQLPSQYEKDQLGCMWGLISMFDFRHGRTTHNLLQDGRNSKRHDPAGGSPTKKNDMSASAENGQGELYEGQATNTCRPSVKKLIEEEMLVEKASKNEKCKAGKQMKQQSSGNGDKKQNNSKKKKKGRSKSLDNIYDLDAAGAVGSEGTCHHRSPKANSNGLDIDILMEELCSNIYQRSMDCLKHGQESEIHLQANQETPEFKEKLCEAVKFLVSEKLMNETFLTEGGELQNSKEVLEALQILSSDEELFLKLLRDPNSLVVRYVPDLPDAQGKKDEDFTSLLGSKYSGKKLDNLTRSNEPCVHRKYRFFRRKSKTNEREALNEKNDLQASKKIVILKPGPSIPETGSSPVLAQKSHHNIQKTEANGEVSSEFLLAEIKSKLKHIMGKDHRRTYSDGQFPVEHQNLVDNRIAKECFQMSLPTKDHLFIENISGQQSGAKKEETLEGPEHFRIGEHKTADISQQKVTNIYIEAKKHLSDLLNSGHENIHVSSRQTPKTLGKILALPDFNMSPISSPGRNWDEGFVTAQMRFASSGEFQKSNDNMQNKHASNLSPTAENSDTHTCTSDDGTNNRTEDNDIITLVESANDNPVEETSSVDNMTVEDTSWTVEETEATMRGESNCSGNSSEPSSSSINKDDAEVSSTQVFEEHAYFECPKLNSCQKDQHPFSVIASPPNSSVTNKVEYAESSGDVQERQSPVSVLEPLFMDDDTSPARTRSHSAETSLKPIKIQFDACGSSVAKESHGTKTCTDDKKIVFEYIKAVLEASSLNWEKLCVVSFSSDWPLDPSLLEEVELSINQLCPDEKLLFDCINEVLMDLCKHFSACSPWVSFVKPNVLPIPNVENICQEVFQGVCWHLLPIPVPHTLEQIVRKDMDKMGTWLDIRHDTDCIGTEIGAAILDDLMEDSMVSFTVAGEEDGASLLQNKVKENSNSIYTDESPEENNAVCPDDKKENAIGVAEF